MKKLILHVGHGKTGSSYLQSIFVLNRDLLEQMGIDYPTHMTDHLAAKGWMTAGNANNLDLGQNFVFKTDKILLSSESLYTKLLFHYPEQLVALLERYDFEVVFYIRNILDYAVSKWGQAVKRDGIFHDVNTYLSSDTMRHGLNLDTYTKCVLMWIEKSKQLGFKLKIRNYSVCKDNLVEDFFTHFLDAEHLIKDIKYPDSQVINRSFSNSEYEIQRLLNVLYGQKNSKYFSDFLVNNFPDVKPLDVKINQSTYDHITRGDLQKLQVINDFIDSDQKLEIGKAKDWIGYNDTMDNNMIFSLGSFIKNKVKQ